MSYTIRAYQVKTGRRWEVRYRKPDGTSTGKRGFQRRMDADAWAAEHVTIAKATGAYIDPTAGRAVVSGLWPEWIQAKRVRLRQSSVYVLETAWRTHVAPVFGGGNRTTRQPGRGGIMTQEYTPTTEKVKRAYSGLHEKNYYDFTFMQREENFDRWLAAHDAELQADAWDDGFTNGRDLAASGQPMTRNNPYREQHA